MPEGREEAEQLITHWKRFEESESNASVHLIALGWWQDWCSFSGFAIDGEGQAYCKPSEAHKRPGPIDNSVLIDKDAPSESICPLLPGLQEGENYRFLLSHTWDKLVEWYSGGPAVARPLLCTSTGTQVDVYPQNFKVSCEGGPIAWINNRQFASAFSWETVGVLKDRALAMLPSLFHQNTSYAIWLGKDRTPVSLLEDRLDLPLGGMFVSHMDSLILMKETEKDRQAREERSARMKRRVQTMKEEQGLPNGHADDHQAMDEDSDQAETNAEGNHASPVFGPEPPESNGHAEANGDAQRDNQHSAPIGLNSSPIFTLNTPTPSNHLLRKSSFEDIVTQSPGRPPGMAGLRNLGNTCFMASSVQCLMHTSPLVSIFLDSAYRKDLNKDNPLGLHGELAEAFAALATKLWQGGVSSVSPVAFKSKVSKFAPQFQGYAQQDGQELLAFLLDGLHEDLNRILVKPYVQESEEEGRSDEQMAAEAWSNYRKRNDSVVVDHLQGLYKSTLVCPDCSHRSVKFDPFTYLTLQLPSSKTRPLTICLLYMDGSQAPCTCSISIPNAGSVGHIYKAVAQVFGIASQQPEEVLLLAEVQNGKVQELLTDVKAPAPEPFVPAFQTAQSHHTPHLLAYHYASPGAGPLAPGLREVRVMHRVDMDGKGYFGRQDLYAVPLVFFVPDEDVAVQNPTGKSRVHFHLLPDSGLAATIKNSLRPFKRRAPETIDDAPIEPLISGLPQGMRTHSLDEIDADDDEMPALHPAASIGSSEEATTEPLQPGSPAAASTSLDTPQGSLQGSPNVSPTGSPRSETHMMDAQLDAEDDEPVPALIHLDAAASSGTDEPADVSMRSARSTDGPQPMAGVSGLSPPQFDTPHWRQASGAGQEQPRPMFSSALPPVRPLDMWASQKPAELPEPTPAASQQATPELRSSFTYDGVTFTSQPVAPSQPASLPGAEETKAAQCSSEAALEICIASESGAVRGTMGPNYELPGKGKPEHVAVVWGKASESAYDIGILERPELHKSVLAATDRQKCGPVSHTLHECVEAFLQPEQLGQADSWYCSQCEAHVQAHKKLDLWSLPEVLIIHLKRFSFSRYRRNKLDNEVTFPLQSLDLSSHLLHPQAVPPVYDLYAVSNHYGGLGGGHYTAYCKVEGQGWADFNDSTVSPEQPDNVQSSAAYLLFYRRRTELQQEAQRKAQLEALLPEPLPVDAASRLTANGFASAPSANGNHAAQPYEDDDDLYGGPASMEGVITAAEPLHSRPSPTPSKLAPPDMPSITQQPDLVVQAAVNSHTDLYAPD